MRDDWMNWAEQKENWCHSWAGYLQNKRGTRASLDTLLTTLRGQGVHEDVIAEVHQWATGNRTDVFRREKVHFSQIFITFRRKKNKALADGKKFNLSTAIEETADEFGVSTRTVEAKWREARKTKNPSWPLGEPKQKK